MKMKKKMFSLSVNGMAHRMTFHQDKKMMDKKMMDKKIMVFKPSRWNKIKITD